MSKKTRVRVTYRRARIDVSKATKGKPALSGRCAACGTKGRTELHHYIYAYPLSRVRSSPNLALDNTIELCFHCHEIANCYRKLVDDPFRANMVQVALIKKIRGGENGNKS